MTSDVSRSGRKLAAAASVFAALAVLVGPLLSAPVAAAPATGAIISQDLIPAPRTTLSADGRSATDGTRTLTVSQASGLAASGQAVSVQGSGYDDFKGVYIAFCMIPPTNQPPTPCGGGIDMGGVTGSSHWISSNPPAVGVGLAVAYGPGGSFAVSVDVSPLISSSVDCRRVRCALITRNDHTRGGDRGQDIFVPVTFAEDSGTPRPPIGGGTVPIDPDDPEAVTTTTAPPVIDDVLPAPDVTFSADGLTASAGTTSLGVSKAADLDPAGEPVTVTGAGYDESKGIGVAFCVLTPEGQVPGPCADGSELANDAVAWISSDPPPGSGAAMPFGEGGSFSLTLATSPMIGEVDCREVPCGVVTSNDATRPSDRSQDLVVPISFAEPVVVAEAVAAAPVTTESIVEPELASSSSSSPWAWIVLGVAIIAGGGTGFALVRRRRNADGAEA